MRSSLHYEGFSRGFRDDPDEVAAFKRSTNAGEIPGIAPHFPLAMKLSLIPTKDRGTPGKADSDRDDSAEPEL